jgi:RimJ/RimL family protein N-acetyltransferase
MFGGRALLETLKARATPTSPCLSIPVGVPIEATLRPVSTAAGKLNVNDVRVLTEWRNRYVSSFLSEFQATEARTEKWLTTMVGPDPTRILFMLDDRYGQTIGYLGLAFINWKERTGEADAIVRGVKGAPGLMTKALKTLLCWADKQVGLSSLSVRVRSTNPALKFYLRLATETRRVSLRPVEELGIKRWIEDVSLSECSNQVVYLTFRRELYLGNIPP